MPKPAAPKRSARTADTPKPKLVPARRKHELANTLRDVEALRDDWKAAVAQHQVRLEAQFSALKRRLQAGPSATVEDVATPKQVERILASLDDVRLKPKKGRGKDLRDVERVLARALKGMGALE